MLALELKNLRLLERLVLLGFRGPSLRLGLRLLVVLMTPL